LREARTFYAGRTLLKSADSVSGNDRSYVVSSLPDCRRRIPLGNVSGAVQFRTPAGTRQGMAQRAGTIHKVVRNASP